ncbi:mediator of RNA polymerase II transcription subunit 11 [Dendrobium catenatum]|uniref:mediator of RNA polymerase II transcription subunit 11 n=1 Tax=Dendrobium catenatum TaxID=906689 RepID=UPI0010A0793C|nr:mediator of RNA polymerase II transcription subunit 11 [Dendrobium catenatum]
MMGPQNQSTSLQRLNHAEKRIVRVLELAGLVMDELANSTGPRTEVLAGHCREFMKSIKVFVSSRSWARFGILVLHYML